jgi:hypothetical protein
MIERLDFPSVILHLEYLPYLAQSGFLKAWVAALNALIQARLEEGIDRLAIDPVNVLSEIFIELNDSGCIIGRGWLNDPLIRSSRKMSVHYFLSDSVEFSI